MAAMPKLIEEYKVGTTSQLRVSRVERWAPLPAGQEQAGIHRWPPRLGGLRWDGFAGSR